MKKFLWLKLLLIPTLLVVMSIFLTLQQGPYWKFSRDPEYAYLMNALSFARFGCCMFHIDHPGTPTQMAYGTMMKMVYQFREEPGSIFAYDVVTYPEEYLLALRVILTFGLAASIFALGWIVFHYTQNQKVTWLVQAFPLLSITTIVEGFVRVSAEAPQIFVMTWLTIFFTIFLFDARWKNASFSLALIRQKEKKVFLGIGWNALVVLFGVLCGVGLAVKLTFLPFVIFIFLALWPLYRKITFVLFTGVGFFVSTWPIWNRLVFVRMWIEGLFWHSGAYGHGEKNIVDLNLFVHNLQTMIDVDRVFFVQMILLAGFLGYTFIKHQPWKTTQSRRGFWLLCSIFFVQIIGLVMTAKLRTSTNRYLIPALGIQGILILTGFNYVSTIQNQLQKKIVWIKPMIVCVCLAHLIYRGIDFQKYFKEQASFRQQADNEREVQLHNMPEFEREKYKKSPHFDALMFGNYWSESKHLDVINQVYSNK